MHLVLFYTSPHVFVFVFSLLYMLLHLMHQIAAIITITFMKMSPCCEQLSARVLCRTFKRKFQRVTGVWNTASSWRRHLKAVKGWNASAGYPPTSVLLGPSSYFSATLLFVQHLPNIMTTCYHVSAFGRDWWKGMWVKTPSGWVHMTNGTELQEKEETLTRCLLSKVTHYHSDLHTYSSVW